MEIKEEPIFTEGVSDLGLQHTDLVRERITNIAINSGDSETFIKKEISAEPWFETAQCELVTDLNSEIDLFSSELLKCKSDTAIDKNNEMGSKMEIKEEPWWLERALRSEVSPASDLQLQNKRNDTCDEKEEVLSPVELRRICKEGDGMYVSGFSADALIERNYGTVREDNIHCEETNISNTVISSTVSSKRSNHSGEDGENNASTLENISLIQEGKIVYKCTICGKTFSWMAWLRKHYVIHETEKLYKCEICKKSFTHKQNLNQHYLVHEGKRRYTCEICGKCFNQNSNLKRHRLIHEGKKPHKCEICGKLYAQEYNLKRHYFTHEGHRPHKCEICDKSFTYRQTLKQHYLIHEGNRQYTCKICGKSYNQNRHLKRHTLNHEGKRLHECEICGKSYAEKQGLKEHVFFHKGQKPHKCKICDKSFTYKRSLRQHFLIHEGKRQYDCDICKKSFTHKNYLKKHISTHGSIF